VPPAKLRDHLLRLDDDDLQTCGKKFGSPPGRLVPGSADGLPKTRLDAEIVAASKTCRPG
jgi:hypothetical protein